MRRVAATEYRHAMPRYLIERRFAGELEIAADEGVTWLHSYVSEDGRKSFDVYEAPSPEAVRRTAARNRLPLDVITQVRVLQPYAYGTGERSTG
jgi:hypothetical protein